MPARRTRLSPSAVRTELAESLAALRRELELPDSFPPEVRAEAVEVAAGPAVDGSDPDRVDLRGVDFLTIDPEGSRDLDQAMHIARDDGDGFVVRYAIADLAAFVRQGGAIDREARRRGQTLYAPDGSVPLHPEELSHGAASLLAGEDRRAYVWTFALDARATVRSAPSLERAWVRSRRQWTYREAQAAVDAGSAPATIALLAAVGPLLVAQEAERGGASLNTPEEEVVDGQDGYLLRRRVPLPIEEWNAQISLLTGMAAAARMLAAGEGVLRTLPPADDEALAQFRRKVELLGRPWDEAVPYGEYLRRLDPGDPVTAAVLQAASALFRGADYAVFLSPSEVPEHAAQAAIGAPYSHVTAPLRRLVDRFALRACLGDVDEEALPSLPETMRRSSASASRLENGVVDRIEAAVLHAGDVHDAVVLSEAKGGVRVQIADPFITATADGAAPAGARVRVRVVATDIAAGTVSLALVDADPGQGGA